MRKQHCFQGTRSFNSKRASQRDIQVRYLTHILSRQTLSIQNTESHPASMLTSCWLYRWTWIWRTQWDQENRSVNIAKSARQYCKIRHIHMMNTWYTSDWDQAYRPSYAKIRRTVVPHIQVHLYNIYFLKRHPGVMYNTHLLRRNLSSVQTTQLLKSQHTRTDTHTH